MENVQNQNGLMKDKDLVIIGRNAVLEALDGHQPIQKVLLQKGITGELEVEIRNRCKELEVPYAAVPVQQLDKWARGRHQGLIALRSPVRFYALNDVVQKAYEEGEMPFILALDGVQDVRNFGAITRTAEAMGVHGVLFPAKGTAMLNEFSVKASAGSLLRQPLIRVRSLENALTELKMSGLKILGADLRAEQSIQNVSFLEPIALVMGSEGEGLRPHIIRLLDERFFIEQTGAAESLNVSVATGIALYQAQMARMNK